MVRALKNIKFHNAITVYGNTYHYFKIDDGLFKLDIVDDLYVRVQHTRSGDVKYSSLLNSTEFTFIEDPIEAKPIEKSTKK